MPTLKRQNEDYWISHIQERIEKNKNFLGIVTGPTGSGKSWSAVSILSKLDSNFDENRIVFTAAGLMDLINNKDLPSGSAILFDEAGVELSAKDWQSTTNKAINFLIQTFRHRNFIMLFTTPDFGFIDKGTRKLFHATFEVEGIDEEHEETLITPKSLQYNGWQDKFYRKYLRVVTEDGNMSPLTQWRVEKPPEDLIEVYEKKKKDFTDNLNKEIMEDIQEEKGDSLTAVQRKVLNMLKEEKTVSEIAEERDRGERTIRETMSQLRDKGYTIDAVYDDEGRHVLKYEVSQD